jgi:hypothetical protein
MERESFRTIQAHAARMRWNPGCTQRTNPCLWSSDASIDSCNCYGAERLWHLRALPDRLKAARMWQEDECWIRKFDLLKFYQETEKMVGSPAERELHHEVRGPARMSCKPFKSISYQCTILPEGWSPS